MQAWDAAAHFSSEELNEWSGRHAQLHKNTHGTDQWKRLAHPGRFKRITSLTHFTAQRSRVELWPRHSWKCAGVYVAEKSLLFAISLSSVSGFLLHCSSISDLLGGWGGDCTRRYSAVVECSLEWTTMRAHCVVVNTAHRKESGKWRNGG